MSGCRPPWPGRREAIRSCPSCFAVGRLSQSYCALPETWPAGPALGPVDADVNRPAGEDPNPGPRKLPRSNSGAWRSKSWRPYYLLWFVVRLAFVGEFLCCVSSSRHVDSRPLACQHQKYRSARSVDFTPHCSCTVLMASRCRCLALTTTGHLYSLASHAEHILLKTPN